MRRFSLKILHSDALLDNHLFDFVSVTVSENIASVCTAIFRSTFRVTATNYVHEEIAWLKVSVYFCEQIIIRAFGFFVNILL